jgi:hypothetical protein
MYLRNCIGRKWGLQKVQLNCVFKSVRSFQNDKNMWCPPIFMLIYNYCFYIKDVLTMTIIQFEWKFHIFSQGQN